MEASIEAGAKSLDMAVKYKVMSTAATGALFGTLIGGPVGLLAGAKLGALVGIGTGVIGYMAAKRYKKPVETVH
jgi:syntaxin 17